MKIKGLVVKERLSVKDLIYGQIKILARDIRRKIYIDIAKQVA